MEDVFGKRTWERIGAIAANPNQPIGSGMRGNKVSGEEEAINFLDAATKPISHTLDFQPWEL